MENGDMVSDDYCVVGPLADIDVIVIRFTNEESRNVFSHRGPLVYPLQQDV
jgi:hypothetical protein